MELKGEARIEAPREVVWAALNDPAVLARAIDGVESLEPDGPNRFRGLLDARVGPVRARFSGTVELTEVDPPNRYVLIGEGKGGVAGFARGQAVVVLAETADGATLLTYTATSTVGGKLAQLGARLVEGAARGYADGFFRNFKAIVEEPANAATSAAAGAPGAAAAASPAPAEPERKAIPAAVWVGALVLLVVAVLAALA
ncbi:CoxG family protein [Thermaurantiacus sp.]